MKQTAQLIGLAVAVGIIGFVLPIGLLAQMPSPPRYSYQGFSNLTNSFHHPTTSPNVQASSIWLEVSLSQRRLTLYRKNNRLKTYPIAIGRTGWETPVGTFQVKQLFLDPQWIQPFTNERIAADDPRNPLGDYWIGFWSDGKNWIGFHGTPDAESVGNATSHGCLRMYNHDIQELFSLVQLGTVVVVKP